MTEIIPDVVMTGRRSMRVRVALWSEDLPTGVRQHAASAEFVMVAVDPNGESMAVDRWTIRRGRCAPRRSESSDAFDILR